MAYNPQNPNGQATMANSEPVVIASDQSAIPVSGTVTATATNLDIRDLVFASDKVDISGSTGVGVTGTFWQATQPVSGTFWQATQPVSLTSTTITGTVAVTGTFWQATQPVSATDLDIRNLVFATDKVDASGTVLGAGTNNIGDVDVLTMPAITGTVTVTGVATEVTLASLLTSSQLIDDTIIVLGTDVYTEAASKGQIIAAVRRDADTTLVGTTNEYGPLQMDVNGRLKVEVFSGETLPVSGTVAATQSGTWNIATTTTVTTLTNITNWGNIVDNAQFTDGTTRLLPAGFIYDEVAGTALTENDAAAARINVNRAQIGIIEDGVTRGRYATVTASNALKVDGSAVTQPVSMTSTTITGTVAVTQSGTWILGANSGVDIGDVTINNAAGASAVNIQDGGNTITVDGTVGISGTVTVSATDLDIRNLVFATDKVDVSGSTSVGVTGTFWQATQPVSATNLDIRDLVAASDAVSVHGDVGILDQLDLTNSNPAVVAIVDANGDQITSFGGGTQYTEDVAAAADPVGTVPILVRADSPSATVTTNGDNIAQRGTNYGAAYVTLLDTAGAPVSVGGGTQYTEDVAAAADPIGTMMMAVGTTTPNASVAPDDNVALRATQGGALFVASDDPNALLTSAFLNTDNSAGNNIMTSISLGQDGLSMVLYDSSGSQLSFPIDGSAAQINGIHALGTDGTDARIISTNASGHINIADGGNTITVDGTVGISGSVAVTGTFWQATQPVSGTVAISTTTIDTKSTTTPVSTMNSASANSGINSAMAAVFDDVSPTSITENSFGFVRMSANRNQYQTIRDAAGNERGANVNASNELLVALSSVPSHAVTLASTTITGSVAVTSAAQDASVVVLGTGTYTEATSTGQVMGAVRRDANTTLVNTTNEFAPLQVNALGALKVGADVAVPVNVQIGNATLSAGVIDETGASAVDALAVGGGTAHDAVDSGNPVKIGAVAIAHGTNPTQVAAADRTALYANRHGIPFSIGGHPNIVSAEYFTSGAITDDNILPAISAGTKYVITSISVTCSAANVTFPAVRIGFGASTLTAQGSTNADAVTKIILSHPGIPAGSGIVKGNGAGIVGIGGDGEELRITCTTPTTSMIVQVDYYTIES